MFLVSLSACVLHTHPGDAILPPRRPTCKKHVEQTALTSCQHHFFAPWFGPRAPPSPQIRSSYVRHPMLRRALHAAGWPAAVAGPLLDAYAAPRRLRIGDAVGQFVNPWAGIPAGCPLAALGTLTWPWHSWSWRPAPRPLAATSMTSRLGRVGLGAKVRRPWPPSGRPRPCTPIGPSSPSAPPSLACLPTALWGGVLSRGLTRPSRSFALFLDLGVQQHAGTTASPPWRPGSRLPAPVLGGSPGSPCRTTGACRPWPPLGRRPLPMARWRVAGRAVWRGGGSVRHSRTPSPPRGGAPPG